MKQSENANYQITVMTPDEMRIALEWAKSEGWNPGINDASVFHQTDPGGFFIGKYNAQPIATISAVKYGQHFGFIGLYIVREDFRGKGFGFKIWEHALSTLAGRNVGLDGVLAQQDNYRKSGFTFAHRNIRFAGKTTRHDSSSTRVIDCKKLQFEHLSLYDQNFFPAQRDIFLKNWINQIDSVSLAIMENSKLVGYGSLRACHQGFKIGPLNAQNRDVARELLLSLTATIPEGSEIFLDVPEPNKYGVQMAEEFGLTPVFETARMYTKDIPRLPLEKIFGITTFELG